MWGVRVFIVATLLFAPCLVFSESFDKSCTEIEEKSLCLHYHHCNWNGNSCYQYKFPKEDNISEATKMWDDIKKPKVVKESRKDKCKKHDDALKCEDQDACYWHVDLDACFVVAVI